jgi:long-chain fatty acid transport protein
MKRRLLSVALLVLALSVYGGGYQLYSESATDVLSVGGAGVARSGAASSAWYNPAATVTIDRTTVSFGGSLLGLAITYANDSHRDKLNDEFRMTGFFYGVQPLNNDLRLTLSVNAPFGMITQWQDKAQLSTLAEYTMLRVCYVSPGLALKVSDEFSVAAGMNVAIGVARIGKQIDMSALGMANNKIYMRASGEGVGGFLSAFYRPHEDWAFGAHYQSPVRVRFAGDASYRFKSSHYGNMLRFDKGNVHTVLTMPGYLALGVENSTFDKLKLMADVVWTQWSVYKDMDIYLDKLAPTGKKGVSPAPRKWHDVMSYRVGAEYQLDEHWVLRGGYMLDISPSNNRYRSPEMPDTNKQMFALGVGYQQANWGIDLGYAFVRFDDGKLGTEIAKKAGIADRGTFSSRVNILSAQFTYRF